MLTRRSILGMFPAGLFGGKRLVAETLDQLQASALDQTSTFVGVSEGLGYGNLTANAPSNAAINSPAWALEELRELVSPSYRATWMEHNPPRRLSPSLASCRSMSLAARMHMQAELDFAEHCRLRKSWLAKSLEVAKVL